jgi:hypothetical protein
VINVAHLSLICFAIVKNACSTFVAFFADVSRKGILSWSANSCQGVKISPNEIFWSNTCLRYAVFYHLLAGKITLIPHQQLIDALRGVPVYLL